MVLFISLWRVPVAPEVPTFLAYLSNFRALRLHSSFVTSPLFGGWAASALRPCGESLGSCAGGWSSLTGPTVLRGCWACFVLPARGKGVPSLSVGCVAQVSHPRLSRSRGSVCGADAPFSPVVGRHALQPTRDRHSCITCQKGSPFLISLLEDLVVLSWWDPCSIPVQLGEVVHLVVCREAYHEPTLCVFDGMQGEGKW